MIAEISAAGPRRVGLLASFRSTPASMPAELPPGVEVVGMLAEGALAALDRGDAAEHDRLSVEAAKRFTGAEAIALGQFSLVHVAPAVAAATGLPLFSTPDSAVRLLRAKLAG